MEDTMVMAMGEVDRTPSPSMTSANRGIKCFTERITKARQPPLLKLPKDMIHGGRTPPALPKRSKRIAVQSIYHISLCLNEVSTLS
jgi:hypothetical protein